MSTDQRSLLRYYSSETTAHATNLLTVALVMLTASQVLREIRPNGHPIPLAMALAVLFAVETWMAGRLAYWAALAVAVIHIDAQTWARYKGTFGGLHDEVCRRVQEPTGSRVTRFSTQFRSLSLSLWGPVLAVLVGGIVGVVVLVFL